MRPGERSGGAGAALPRISEGAWLAGILLVAVLLRVGIALYLGDVVDAPPLLTDQRSYHALGERLLQGHGYSFASAWYPFTPADTPTAHWSFLYPLFIAATYALFGVHPLAVRLCQGVAGGILVPWLVYRLAKTVFPARRGVPLVAAGIAAVYAYLALYAATLMTETLFIALVLWSLEVSLRLAYAIRSGDPARWRDYALLGLGLGAAVLTRQSILPWIPVLVLFLGWQAHRVGLARQVVRRLLLTGALVILMVCPWTYRNYRVYGEFLLLNSNTGYAMYAAQHPMHGTTFQEYATAPLPADLAGLNEAEMDRALLRRGLQFVLDEPGRYVRLCLSRVRAFLEFWPTPDTTPLHNLGRVGSFGLLLPLLVYGLVLALCDRDLAARSALLVIFALFYSTLHVLTWAMVRYRLPVDAVCLPLAALGVNDLARRGKEWLARRRVQPESVPIHTATGQ